MRHGFFALNVLCLRGRFNCKDAYYFSSSLRYILILCLWQHTQHTANYVTLWFIRKAPNIFLMKLIWCFKGLHLKMKIVYLPSCRSKPVCIFFLLLNTKEDILKNVGNQTVLVPIDIYCTFFVNTMVPMGSKNVFSKLWTNVIPLTLK